MSPSWNSHPRSRESRSRPEDGFEVPGSCARIGWAQKRRRIGRENRQHRAAQKCFHSVSANSMLHPAVLILTGTYYAYANISPPRSSGSQRKRQGRWVICGAFLLNFHSGEFCGLRIYLLALEFGGLPPDESISRDSQQSLGDVHALPCFLLCLGPLFRFPLKTWPRAR